MRLAIDEARRAEGLGEVPIGAVVVYEPIDPATRRPLAEPRVIARACNLRETSLMHQARIDRCVYGAPDPKAGALGTLYRINEDERLNHNFTAAPGVLGDECAEMLRAFFARKRRKRTEPR